MQLFGIKLFEKKKVDKLYDFAQHGILRMQENYGETAYIELVTQDVPPNKKKVAKKKEVPKPTPKEIYQLKTLNQPEFQVNADPGYLDKEIAILEKKLSLYPTPPKKKKKGVEGILMGEGGAVAYGRKEVQSMIERLNNRRKISVVMAQVNKYPHTTNEAVRQVLADNKHLEARQVEPMLPDLPDEAVDAMKEYTELCKTLCGKRPVFYLIAERKDEREVQRKRDPILLAQSPFGFFWQILGAWDKEVVLLDEL